MFCSVKALFWRVSSALSSRSWAIIAAMLVASVAGAGVEVVVAGSRSLSRLSSWPMLRTAAAKVAPCMEQLHEPHLAMMP